MLSAAYITNVSKDKQCGLNQTAPDMGPHISASTLIDKVGLLAFKTWAYDVLVAFNPFMPNVFSYPYQLDESISNFRIVGWYFSF